MPLLIDADVHISPSSQGGNSITTDELLRRMDRVGIDKAVTWLQPPYVRSEIDAGNAYVVRAMREQPERILGFGCADPNLGADRVCFGSDTPFELMHVELAKCRALLEGEISSEEFAEVMGGTIARVLRLND